MILSTVTIVHIGANIDNTVLAVGDSESSPHITLVSNVSLVSRTEGISCAGFHTEKIDRWAKSKFQKNGWEGGASLISMCLHVGG